LTKTVLDPVAATKMRTMWDRGATVQEIAKEFHITVKRVADILDLKKTTYRSEGHRRGRPRTTWRRL